MSETAATIGTGCSLSIDDTAGGVGIEWTVFIPEVTSASIDNSGDIIDVTAIDQSALGQFVMGSRGATLSFAGNFIPDLTNLTVMALITLFQARTTISFKLLFNDAGTASFAIGSGFFTNLTMSCSGHDSALQFSGTIRIQPTETYANGVTFTFTA